MVGAGAVSSAAFPFPRFPGPLPDAADPEPEADNEGTVRFSSTDPALRSERMLRAEVGVGVAEDEGFPFPEPDASSPMVITSTGR